MKMYKFDPCDYDLEYYVLAKSKADAKRILIEESEKFEKMHKKNPESHHNYTAKSLREAAALVRKYEIEEYNYGEIGYGGVS